MKFLLKVAITATAVWITTLIVPLHIEVTGGDSWWQRVLVFVFVGFVLVILNAVLKPILKVLSLPLLILTLGLFSLVISWFVLWLTAKLTTLVDFAELTIDGFWRTLLAALVIAIVTAILEAVIPGAKGKRR